MTDGEIAREILRPEIDRLIQLREEEHRIGETKTQIIKRMVEKLEEKGMESNKISRIIKEIVDENDIPISEDTIERACGPEHKRKHTPDPQNADPETPRILLADGTTHMDGNPKELGDEYGKGVVPMPHEEQRPRPRLVSYRIVMNAKVMDRLGKLMQEKVKENGMNRLYAIEHDPNTGDLYVDVAEKGEEVNT